MAAIMRCRGLRRVAGRSLPCCCTSHTSNYSRQSLRQKSSIFFADEKGTAEEAVYFRKEDEALLKNLLANHPEYDPKYSTSFMEQQAGTLGRDLQLVCHKHGIHNVSLAFYKDLQAVFELNGWKPEQTRKGRGPAGATIGASASSFAGGVTARPISK